MCYPITGGSCSRIFDSLVGLATPTYCAKTFQQDVANNRLIWYRRGCRVEASSMSQYVMSGELCCANTTTCKRRRADLTVKLTNSWRPVDARRWQCRCPSYAIIALLGHVHRSLHLHLHPSGLTQQLAGSRRLDRAGVDLSGLTVRIPATRVFDRLMPGWQL